MSGASPTAAPRQSVTFAPSHRPLRPSKSSSDLSTAEIDMDATLGASTSTSGGQGRPSGSSEGGFFSFDTTAIRTPSIRSLASIKGKGKGKAPAPTLEVTPPPSAQFTTRRSRLLSITSSEEGSPRNSDSSDDVFYPRRSGSAPLSGGTGGGLPASFYQQAKNGGKVQSSPDLLLGPLLTDYYKSHPAPFQPEAISTPDRSAFTIRPPAHPSSIPVRGAAKPLFFIERADPPPPQPTVPAFLEQPLPRKAPSFSSLRKWLPGQTDEKDGHLDVERLSENSLSVAERERNVSLGKKEEDSRLEALRRVKESGRMPSPVPTALAPALLHDVFSSDPSAPSFYPLPSPPHLNFPSSHSMSTSSSKSSTYHTAPSSSQHDLTALPNTSFVSFPTEETPRNSLDVPFTSTPGRQAPTPPPRRFHDLLQRPPALSVIEGSPFSYRTSTRDRIGSDTTRAHTPVPVEESRTPRVADFGFSQYHVTHPIQQSYFASPPDSPTMMQEEDLIPPPKIIDDEDSRTDVTSTRKATTSWGSAPTIVARRSARSSFQNFFRWSKQGSVAESSTTGGGSAHPSIRPRTKSEIADEEFMSRSSTPNSAEVVMSMKALKHRRHWSSRGDEDDVIETFRPPMSPMSPAMSDDGLPRTSRDSGRRRVVTRESISSPRELILPSVVASRKPDDIHRPPRASFQTPLTPSPSPPPRPAPAPPLHTPSEQRRVRVLSGPNHNRRSSIFAGKQRPLLLGRQPAAEGEIQIPASSSPSTPLSSLSSSSSRRPIPEMTAIEVIKHPLIALDTLLPAQSMFILGFLLGPWAWIVGGYLLSLDGYVPSRDREGAAASPMRIARPRPSTTTGTSSTSRSQAHTQDLSASVASASSSTRLRNYERDAAALNSAELMHHPLARNPSVMPGTGQMFVEKLRMSAKTLSVVRGDTITRDEDGLDGLEVRSMPCDWVWRCRAAALTSGVIITGVATVAIIAAAHGGL